MCVLAFFQGEDRRLPKHKRDSTISASIRKFIPKEYIVLDQANGDVNGDGLKDKILVLWRRNEIVSGEKRPVIILLKLPNGSFHKAAENDDISLSYDQGGVHGDPFHGITIKNNCFSIEHFGGSSWRWNQVITFKYDGSKQNWYLYSVGSESWHFNPKTNFTSKHETERDFGKVLFTKYKNKWRDNEDYLYPNRLRYLSQQLHRLINTLHVLDAQPQGVLHFF
jgi:hypothetical protein